MDLTNNFSCASCANKFKGNDGVDYCRTSTAQFGLKCSPEAAEDCRDFEDKAAVAESPWFAGAWCLGRAA